LSGAEELIGTIREDQKIVTVTPHLHILKDSGPVCRYELTPVAGTKELPFEVDVLDNALGTAQIHLRDGADIDCSDVEFRMHLVAVRCADDSAKSEPVTLKVVIQDVNNHAPEFDAPWYTFDVEEGRSLEVTRLFAIDKDCGHPYGKVCRYEITNPPENNPFQIDDQGVLSITKPLNRSQAESHILTIVAHDCGMLRSKSTLVTVHVKSRCVDGIRNKVHGTNEPLAVELGDESRKRAFEGAEIVTCGDTCQVKSAEVLVKLQKNEKGKKSVTERIHECEINPATTELLKDGSQSEASEDEFDEDDEDDVTSEGASSSATTFDGKKTSVSVQS
jgi:hypothetical protein